MRKLIQPFILSGMALLPLAHASAAFEPTIVQADSKWVVYADVALFRETTFGRELIEQFFKTHHPMAPNSKVQIDFQKLITTIGSVTAYGSNFSKDAKLIDGALVIQGTSDLRKIAEAYVTQATMTSPDSISEIKGLPFDSYLVGSQLYVGFPAEPIILVSKSKSQLTKAYEVFKGRAPSLAKASSSPLASLLSYSGTPYLLVGSAVPDESVFPKDAPPARILQMAESGALQISETSDKKTDAILRLNARSSEEADKLSKIAAGIAASMSFIETNDQQLNEFMKTTQVERQEKSFSVHLSYPSERLVELIESSHEKGAQAAGMASSSPRSAAASGKVVAEWKSDQDTVAEGQPAGSFAYHTIENVKLQTGSLVTLRARSERGGARFDSIEVTPSEGAASPFRFKAEFMRLERFRVEPLVVDAKAKAVALTQPSGSAQFQFPADEGVYTIRVHYVPDPEGKASFTLSVKND